MRVGFFVCLSLYDCLGYFLRIIAIDLKHIPVPCTVFGRIVLTVYGVYHCRKLYAVAVVEHDEVRQSEISGNTAGALRDFLLDATVGNEGICLMSHGLSETGFEETLCDSTADSHCMALTQRTGGVFDTAFGVELGMAGSNGTPLAELLELVEGIVACESEHGIEHRRHVAGIEEETVAGEPGGIVGIGYEELREQNVHEISAAHGAAGMARFSFFDHRGSQNTDIIGCAVQSFCVHCVMHCFFRGTGTAPVPQWIMRVFGLGYLSFPGKITILMLSHTVITLSAFLS